MSVGVPALDADHKTLINLINNLQRSIGDEEEFATVGSVLMALDDYVEHHFAREARMMEVCRYPSLSAHVAMHRRLSAQVREFQQAYEADPTAVRARKCLAFLNKWLIEHICSTDMDYRGWVIGHADALSAAESVVMTGPRTATSLDWRSLKVLVVDDNQNFCQIMRTILEGVGVMETRVVADVEAAKAALLGKAVDILVADWHVGRDSGLDLIAWLRAQPGLARLPVLVLSGHERLSNRDVALGAGADEFMEKPISARGLLICLSKLMRKGREG